MDNNLNINTLQCDLSVCRESSNIIDELDKGIIVDNPDLQQHNFNKIPASPHILCNINNIKIWSLVDSGSQITAVSESFYNELKKIMIYMHCQ